MPGTVQTYSEKHYMPSKLTKCGWRAQALVVPTRPGSAQSEDLDILNFGEGECQLYVTHQDLGRGNLTGKLILEGLACDGC